MAHHAPNHGCKLRQVAVVLRRLRFGHCGVGLVTFCWAHTVAAARHRTRPESENSFIEGSIIARSPECPERRQTSRLNNLNLHVAVLAVVLLIGGRISQNVLIAQFHADFGRDVRQFVDVSASYMRPPVCSATSVSNPGPVASSGVRPRARPFRKFRSHRFGRPLPSPGS